MEPTSSATSAGEPKAIPLPQSARAFTRSGAVNFVNHYVAVLDRASKTGDTADLQALSSASCVGCSDFIDLYQQTYSDGGWIRGSEWTLRDPLVRFSPEEEAESFVTADVNVADGSAKRSRTAATETHAATTTQVSFAVRYRDGWEVTQFGVGGVDE